MKIQHENIDATTNFKVDFLRGRKGPASNSYGSNIPSTSLLDNTSPIKISPVMPQTRRRYVHQGSLIGDPYWIDKPWHAYIDWKRVAWIAVPLLILCVTNPANQDAWRSFMSSTPKTSSKWMAPRVTNYGILSLEEKIEGVVISALQQSYLCEFRSSSFGDVCEYLADSFCHQRGLWGDADDLAFTTHRFLCWILILWTLFDFCCPTAPPRRIIPNSYIIDGILFSTFYKPHNLLHDLVYQSFCVYPALVEMAKVIPRLNSGSILSTGDTTFDYVIAVFLLVAIIGGGSNVLASRIDGQRTYVTGFAPVIAASLGYHHRINVVRSTVLMRMYGIDMTAIRLYWSSIAWIIFAYPNGWYPRLVAWLAAGLGGSLLAKYHLENIAVFGDVLKFFGLT